MHIKVSGKIRIAKDSQTVFNFISNLENDKFWRKEINSSKMTMKPQVNARTTENSYLSKRVPNNILNLICTEYIENQKVIYQTMPDSKFFLKSVRIIDPISQNETMFLYTIEFDKNIVKHALGFRLPIFIINLVAKNDMKKYLAKVKTFIEN